MNNTYDSIIFDLDGTLWDSTETIAIAWQQALEAFGMDGRSINSETVRGLAGMPYNAIYDKLFPELKGEKREQLQKLCASKELEVLQQLGGKLYPEVKETLSHLATKYKLAIVSNCQSGYIETFLDHHQLHPYFIDHECYGNKGISKGDNIREVVRRNKLERAVYIGDTTGDYEASLQANVPFILAGFGFGNVKEEVHTINSFSELKKL